MPESNRKQAARYDYVFCSLTLYKVVLFADIIW